ncbi:MAG: M36 family metallopeptidase, partial [Bacteroidota bacterium]
TGGPTNVGCLSGGDQMGEGWSDYYGAMFTMRAQDTRVTRRGIGTYSLGEPITGDGIRPAPYTTNTAVNDFTYGDTQGACSFFCQISIPHGVGFIWATILWEMTWDLIDQHGFSEDFYDADGTAGNQIALNLVTEGMKLQPCRPGFVDGRDAILAADDALYGGAHKDLIWAAFARRGLGFSAIQGSSSSVSDNREAFDLPPGGGNVDPVAGFTADCDGLTCDFTDTSSDSDGSITGRSWDFGDGATSMAANPSHTYASAGTYTVSLTVTDNAGATDDASDAVTVSGGGGGEDTTAPSLSGAIQGGQYNGTATDSGSGITTVALRDATNLDLDVDAFGAGAGSVDFTITLQNRRNQGKGYVVATDVAGNESELWICSDGCDEPGGGGDDTAAPSVTGSIKGAKFDGTASDSGSGIATVALSSDAVNLALDVDGFSAGASSVGFEVTLIDKTQPGSGTIVATDVEGNEGTLFVDSEDRAEAAMAASSTTLPEVATLYGSYPNPFAATTTVRFALPEAADVQVVVYDVTGREVARLADGPAKSGFHTATFDGSALPSGVYVVRLSADGRAETQRMVLAR